MEHLLLEWLEEWGDSMQDGVENARQICQIEDNMLMSAYFVRMSPEFDSLAWMSKSGHGYAHL